MKKMYIVLLLLVICLILFKGCCFFENAKFSEIKPGENFAHSRDGFHKKLPQNYGVSVDLGSTAKLFKVPEEYVNVEWATSVYYADIIVESHFIKGFYTSDYLVLCEEKNDDALEYIVFDFSGEQIQRFLEIEEVHKLLNTEAIQWFGLCNTNEEIRSIPHP